MVTNLNKGDILKFGRARLRVTELCMGDGSSNLDTRIKEIQSDSDIELSEGFFVTEEDLGDEPACRICFNGEDKDNPLISLCN